MPSEPDGLDPDAVAALRQRVRREIDDGLLPSCQIALAHDGRVVLDETFGAATPGTRYVIFSVTKAFVAAAVWHLIAEAKLEPERCVVDYIPEFATNGKEAIAVEQVLLHTSGFPHAPFRPDGWGDRARRVETFERWRLNWEPGTAYEYHASSAHWVLAELIERVSGQDFRDYVHARVTRPLGLPRVLGLPASERGHVADLALCGEPPTAAELEELFGVSELPVGEVTDDALLRFNEPGIRASGMPGGGGIASAATVAAFYQALVHNPGGVWDPDVLADGTGRVRNVLPDPLLGVPANRTLGLVVAGDDGRAHLRGFGHTQGPRTFGHNGAGGQIAWADPDSGLSFCYLTNGRDRNPIREGRRTVGISSRAAVCLPNSTQ